MKPIYTLDIETDPFVYGRDPKPFVCGLYTGDKFTYTWGDDCIVQMHRIVRDMEPAIIYAHNGGKFDFFFMMDWISEQMPVMIINGRIVRAYAWRNNDEQYHELRDSFALMPFALKKYKKDEIDYRTFERAKREKHCAEILRYLQDDCKYLHELCVEFADRFGDNLTIGSTSMKQLRKLHTFDTLDAEQDKLIRDSYYYGGRVQCFESGIVKPSKGAHFVAYDLNQCYPYSMRNFKHPIGVPTVRTDGRITDRTFFVTVEGDNFNAFPQRSKDGLCFDTLGGIFGVSIHEFNAAVETGMFVVHNIRQTVDFDMVGDFGDFVDHFHGLRRDAQLANDKVGALFYKYVCNSAYGKFAQNPDAYHDYRITDASANLSVQLNDTEWTPCIINDACEYIVWQHPSLNTSRYNVATGASITGAARSLLIRALAHAKRPLYCDTDSIICEGLEGVKIDETELGAWKVEQTGDRMAIGGRKLYALFKGKECVKLASKGVHLTPEQILAVCKGATITWKKDAPSFNFKAHETRYIKRDVRMTAGSNT